MALQALGDLRRCLVLAEEMGDLEYIDGVDPGCAMDIRDPHRIIRHFNNSSAREIISFVIHRKHEQIITGPRFRY